MPVPPYPAPRAFPGARGAAARTRGRILIQLELQEKKKKPKQERVIQLVRCGALQHLRADVRDPEERRASFKNTCTAPTPHFPHG